MLSVRYFDLQLSEQLHLQLQSLVELAVRKELKR
jgi:hypothetical protein